RARLPMVCPPPALDQKYVKYTASMSVVSPRFDVVPPPGATMLPMTLPMIARPMPSMKIANARVHQPAFSVVVAMGMVVVVMVFPTPFLAPNYTEMANLLGPSSHCWRYASAGRSEEHT